MNSKLTFLYGMAGRMRTEAGLARLLLVSATVALASVSSSGQQPSSAAAPRATPVAELVAGVKVQAPAQDNAVDKSPPNPSENEKKKQINDQSTKLLTMALSLKAEVDKTTKDTLSLNVIRKADEIEKLAHTVKEKMKTAVGPS
jgi:hypothetical protein